MAKTTSRHAMGMHLRRIPPLWGHSREYGSARSIGGAAPRADGVQCKVRATAGHAPRPMSRSGRLPPDNPRSRMLRQHPFSSTRCASPVWSASPNIPNRPSFEPRIDENVQDYTIVMEGDPGAGGGRGSCAEGVGDAQRAVMYPGDHADVSEGRASVGSRRRHQRVSRKYKCRRS